MDIQKINDAMHGAAEIPMMMVKQHQDACQSIAIELSKNHDISHALAYGLVAQLRDGIIDGYKKSAESLMRRKGGTFSEAVFAKMIVESSDTVDNLALRAAEKALVTMKGRQRRQSEAGVGIERSMASDANYVKHESLAPEVRVRGGSDE